MQTVFIAKGVFSPHVFSSTMSLGGRTMQGCILLLAVAVLFLSAPSVAGSNIELPWYYGVTEAEASATINATDTVVWTWSDDYEHSIYSEDGIFKGEGGGEATASGRGFTYTHTFVNPGMYEYYCFYHGKDMKGTISVIQSFGGDPTPPQSGSPPPSKAKSPPPPIKKSPPPPKKSTPPSPKRSPPPPKEKSPPPPKKLPPPPPPPAKKINWFLGVTQAAASAKIVVGQNVTWIWTDAVPHTIKGKDGAAVGLFTGVGGGDIAVRAPFSYSFRFDKAGEFKYECGVHGAKMQGKIQVSKAPVHPPPPPKKSPPPPKQSSSPPPPKKSPLPPKNKSPPPPKKKSPPPPKKKSPPPPKSKSPPPPNNRSPPPPKNKSPPPPKKSPPPPPGPGAQVKELDWFFGVTPEAASATVKVGTTVQWKWADELPHSIMGLDAAFGLFKGDGGGDNIRSSPFTYSHTFTVKGTFPYQCAVHLDEMTGTITVVVAAVLDQTVQDPVP
eukprot:jgi/Mesen1/4831/ME000243S04013